MLCPECRYEYFPIKAINLCECPVCKSNFIDTIIEYNNGFNPLGLLRDAVYYLGDDCLKNIKLLKVLINNMYKEDKELKKLFMISLNENVAFKMYNLLDKIDRNSELELIKSDLISEAYLSESASNKIIDYWSYVLDFDENENTIRAFDNYHYLNSKEELIFENKINNFKLNFSENLAYTGDQPDGQYYIDPRGKKVIDLFSIISRQDCSVLDYFYFGDFHEGLATIKYKFGNYGFINKKPIIVIDCIYEDALPFSCGLAAVKLNGLWGYIDSSGTQIIKNKYDKVYSFSEDKALVYSNDNWTFIDKNGEIILSLKEYSNAEPFKNDIAKVKRKNKFGFINKSGTEVISIKYDDASTINNDLIKVRYSKWGVINKDENIIIPFNFENIQIIASCFLVVSKQVTNNNKKGYLYGLFNFKGEKLLDIKYNSIELLDNDIMFLSRSENILELGEDGEEYEIEDFEFWLYNIPLHRLIKTDYRTDKFCNGLAIVQHNNLYGYIDKNGLVVIPIKYQYARPFFSKLSFVSKNTQWEFGDKIDVTIEDDEVVSYYKEKSFKLLSIINSKGGVITENKIIEATDFQKGISFIGKYLSMKNIVYGCINSKGHWTYSDRNSNFINKTLNYLYKYDLVELFSDKLFTIHLDERCGLVDKNGKVIIEPKYRKINAFNDDILKVKDYTTGLWALVDTNDRLICPFKYTIIGNYQRGLAVVVDGKSKKLGCIDETGTEMIPLIYDSLSLVLIFDNLYCVKKEKKWGFINDKGEVIVDFQYDVIGYASNGYALVGVGSNFNHQWFGKFSLIDKEGFELLSNMESIGFMEIDGTTNESLTFTSLNNYDEYKLVLKRKKRLEYLDDFWKCNFYEGVTRYSRNRKYGLVNEFGHFIGCDNYYDNPSDFKPVLYDYIEKPKFGLFKVRLGKSYGFINADGIEIIKCKYHVVGEFKNGLCKVNLGGSYDRNLDEYVFKGGLWGFVNLIGEEQIPIEFDELDDFNNGYAIGKKKYRYIKIDTFGNII